MRNIYSCYTLCKHILNNISVHMCKDPICEARGKGGTSLFEGPKNIFKKKNAITLWHKYLVMKKFCADRGYIELYWCDKESTSFVSVTSKGIELTDNIFLPFTPIGLWKEIWKEHKVIFSILYSLAALITSSGILGIIKLVSKIG